MAFHTPLVLNLAQGWLRSGMRVQWVKRDIRACFESRHERTLHYALKPIFTDKDILCATPRSRCLSYDRSEARRRSYTAVFHLLEVPSAMDGSKFAIHGTVYPLFDRYDELLTNLTKNLSTFYRERHSTPSTMLRQHAEEFRIWRGG